MDYSCTKFFARTRREVKVVDGNHPVGDTGHRSRRRWWYLVLLLPFLGTLFPGLYNMASPSLIGLPFFYWYQLVWVIVGAGIVALVYAQTR